MSERFAEQGAPLEVTQAWCAGSSKVPARTTHDASETQSALCPECDSYVGISRGGMVALHRAPLDEDAWDDDACGCRVHPRSCAWNGPCCELCTHGAEEAHGECCAAPRPCCATWRECPHGLASAGLPIPTEVRERRCDPSTPQGYEVFCGFAGLHGGHLLPSGTWCAGTPRQADDHDAGQERLMKTLDAAFSEALTESGGPCPKCGGYQGEFHRLGIRCGNDDRDADV